MLQLQLFIEGKEVELYKDESISLTQSIQDIKDISKVFTDFTKTFNVPASKNNNKIFKHFYDFNIRSYNTNTNQFEHFDARKKKEAKIFLNHKPFKGGKIKFEGVQLKNNEPHTYKITFFGNTVNLKDVLGEDKLSNLSRLNEFDFIYNTENIASYMADGKDVDFFGGTIEEAIVFPLITHTGRLIFDLTTPNSGNIYNVGLGGVPMTQLKPAIRIHAIIKAIENQQGYNLVFSDDFFNSINTSYYNLYMWLHNKEGGLFVDQEAQYQIINLGNVIGDTTDINGVSSKSFNNVYSSDNSSRTMNVTVTPSTGNEYNLIIKKDGEDFKRYDGLTNETVNGGQDSFNIPTGNYTFFIETDLQTTFNVSIQVIQENKGIFKTKKDITFSGSTSFDVNKEVNITSIIPEMKVIDFITGLFKMFNLTAYQNNEGVIIVQTLDDFYNSSTQVWDITKDLDKSSTMVDTIIPFKEVDFKYESTGSFLANNHKQLANKEWGALNYSANNGKLEGDKYEIEIPFEHFKYENIGGAIQYGYSVDENQEPYLGLPLLFYAKKPLLSGVKVIELDGTTVRNIVEPYMPLNRNSIFSGEFGNLFDGQSINFNEEYDEYTKKPESTTLFNTYYKNYVKDMFDVRKRLTTIKAYLPIEITIKLNLADRIIVFDNIYRINKITTNFETNLSTIELTNIFDEVAYTTIAEVASNCLTVDTTLEKADNFILKVDANCDTDFTIPDLTTVVPNEVPINNPTPVYDNVPLTVTPPIIEEYTVTVPTSTSVFFDYKITSMGKLGDTTQLDEYGFLYSTTQSNLTASDNIDVLKGTSGVFQVPFLTTSFFTAPKVVGYEKSGLTDPSTYYWRFYARTNTDTAHSFADAISEVKTASTVSAPVNQYNNAAGELLSGYVTTQDTGTCTYCHGTMQFGYGTYSNQLDPVDLDGVNDFIRFYNIMNKWDANTYKKIVQWFASEPDPVLGTWYPITHTWKYLNNQGDDGFFNMGIISNAYVKFDLTPRNRIYIYIKGGVITGSSFGGGSGNILNNTGDLESTS